MVKCEVLLDTVNKIADFIKVTSRIEEDIDLSKGRYTIDAKSIVALFTLDLSKVAILTIHSDDEKLLDKFNEWRVWDEHFFIRKYYYIMYKQIDNVRVYGLDESIKASKYPMSVDIDKLNSDITSTVCK